MTSLMTSLKALVTTWLVAASADSNTTRQLMEDTTMGIGDQFADSTAIGSDIPLQLMETTHVGMGGLSQLWTGSAILFGNVKYYVSPTLRNGFENKYCPINDRQKVFVVHILHGSVVRATYWQHGSPHGRSRRALNSCAKANRRRANCRVVDAGGKNCHWARAYWKRTFCNMHGSVGLQIQAGIETSETWSSSLALEVGTEIEAGVVFAKAAATASTTAEIGAEWSRTTQHSVTNTASCDVYENGKKFKGGCMWQWTMKIKSRKISEVTWSTGHVACTRLQHPPTCPPFQKLAAGRCKDMTLFEKRGRYVQASTVGAKSSIGLTLGLTVALFAGGVPTVLVALRYKRTRQPHEELLHVVHQ
mmetsp:Transcript_116334/g.231934  ORF Transcript_116334/g.231934 Transcript_116334/m.231934 type:complete len:361 (+) Transcript_116334:172-1254(+)|eukprot:CAMPEP_0172731444 /NCGR_PEP_ID=MMETSP1074-20121228/101337_1 /TAXON_ID=2916 /ORGANISM="Ceratium fusus, Strain PA161109" /LENGTH=360 /DNA_ID=CAMNT_0013559471 /DNA_START=42 /DNA_END=1124 /DNA_ORIENTATION=-